MRGYSRTVRRVVPATFALTALLLSVLPAVAAPIRYCSPWPEVVTSFCASYDGQFATVQAAAPLTATIIVANESQQVTTVKNTWIETAEISLLAGAGSTPRVTASANLPNGLIVLGGGSCTSPSFNDCGGYGTLLAEVTNGAPFNGIREGTFGIRRLTNVNPPAAGFHGDYVADLLFCIQGLPTCQAATATVRMAEGAGGAVGALALPARHTQQFNTGFGTATVDAAIRTATLNLEGDADTLLGEGGEVPTDQPYRVFSTPVRCGLATSGGRFTAFDGRWVSVTQHPTITGCPTAAFTAQPDQYAVQLNGSPSTTPVEDRTVAKWLWRFGDGSTRTTTVPTVRHTYTSYGNHTVSLVVEDSEGARSASVSKVVKGTVTSLSVEKANGRARAFGGVEPNHPGRNVTVTLLRYRDGAYRPVVDRTVELNSNSRYSTAFDRRPAGKCQFRVAFAGDADHLGSKNQKNFAC